MINFKGAWKIIPYNDLIPNLIFKFHNDSIHTGVNTTADLIISHGFYWSGIYQDVRTIVQNCKICNEKNPNCPSKSITPIVSKRPRERYQLDLTELEPEIIQHYKTNHRYILTIEDHFSKFGDGFLQKSKEALIISNNL